MQGLFWIYIHQERNEQKLEKKKSGAKIKKEYVQLKQEKTAERVEFWWKFHSIWPNITQLIWIFLFPELCVVCSLNHPSQQSILHNSRGNWKSILSILHISNKMWTESFWLSSASGNIPSNFENKQNKRTFTIRMSSKAKSYKVHFIKRITLLVYARNLTDLYFNYCWRWFDFYNIFIKWNRLFCKSRDRLLKER